MNIAIVSDIHDNEVRLKEALEICIAKSVKNCICCGDVGQLETLETLASAFDKVFFALGNADYNLLNKTGLFPQNIEWNENILEMKLDKLRIAIVHHDYKAKELAKSGDFDVIFYGHTHTPWGKRTGNTLLMNPGEIAGQFGKASFAIFDTDNMKAELKLLK